MDVNSKKNLKLLCSAFENSYFYIFKMVGKIIVKTINDKDSYSDAKLWKFNELYFEVL